MDSISHAFLGVAVAALSGHPLSIHDPVYIAAVLGAEAPDFDILVWVRSHFAYLKAHRAFSHSFLGLLVLAGFFTTVAYGIGFTSDFLAFFGWFLAGSLSHSFIDYFNTHGVSLLWPVSKIRQTNHLLNVVDPLLWLLFCIPYLISQAPLFISQTTFLVLTLYLMFRAVLRRLVTKRLTHLYTSQPISQIAVMPNLQRIFTWDFVLQSADTYIIGEYSLITGEPLIRQTLQRREEPQAVLQLLQATPLGNFFESFTPFLYWDVKRLESGLLVTCYDLRYYVDQKFVHSGMIRFDRHNQPCISYLYTYNRMIQLPV